MEPTTTTTTSHEKPTQFPQFPALPAEIREQIWTIALLAPLAPSPTTTTPNAPRPMHIRPFKTLSVDQRLIDFYSSVPMHLAQTATDPDWWESPLLDHLERDAAAACREKVAMVRRAQIDFQDPPRGGGSGTALGVSGHDSGVLVAAEAARELRRLKWRLGEPEEWVDLDKGLCCFWDVDSSNAARTEPCSHPRLVPSLDLADALSLEDGPVACQRGSSGMVRGYSGLVTGTAHCEELAVMWSSGFCPKIHASKERLGDTPACEDFQKQLKDLVSRHPKLHTLYLLDPSVMPRKSFVPPGSEVKFRGDQASFYAIDLSQTDDWSVPLLVAHQVDVFAWAHCLETLLSKAKKETQAEGNIQVKVLACVPDWDPLRALTKMLEDPLPGTEEGNAYLTIAGALFAAAALLGSALPRQG
ncbi:uncharacterized protein B0H64DRAFT_436317 [Chaetomium fimeti]|uniref:2EXR domain-containing protein n=1 Tax=Chaetomium fimeti TaxID=1854472 RepID=A0AAE0LMT8_9PEZI|nr:hypothetical protein B0H64DRAFT_436317 [Chaetomium fimeti]